MLPPSPSTQPDRARWLLWVGVIVFLLSGTDAVVRLPGLPYHDGQVRWHRPHRPHVPLVELAEVRQALERPEGAAAALWRQRMWYPYVLGVVWLLALLASMGGRRRLLVGSVLWCITGGLLVLEAAYLRADYEPFLAGRLGAVETGACYLAVVAVLLWRGPRHRSPRALEATIATQALLSGLHLLTIPGTFARRWWQAAESAPLPTVLDRLLQTHAPSFGLALLALTLTVVAGCKARRVEEASRALAASGATQARDRRSPG